MAPNLLRFLCGDYLAGFFLLLSFLQRLFHFFGHCGSGSASGGGAGHQGASLQGGWAQSWLRCWSSKCRVQVFTESKSILVLKGRGSDFPSGLWAGCWASCEKGCEDDAVSELPGSLCPMSYPGPSPPWVAGLVSWLLPASSPSRLLPPPSSPSMWHFMLLSSTCFFHVHRFPSLQSPSQSLGGVSEGRKG